MRIQSLTLSILFLLNYQLLGQKVSGDILDAENNDQLIGSSVSFESIETGEKYQAISGLDGSYQINNIPASLYKVTIRYVGYQPFYEEINISLNSNSINFSLDRDYGVLSEVVVKGDNRGTDSQARILERKSSNVINIISANQIQLSPDITVANVIQRVSGLSIERNASGDPQYAIVRGMDKRYNNTLVNGIKIPSPDNENRFVPLDIFPAVFLERLEVSKSLSADMEADAIGGTVNMVMKNAPNSRIFDADFQVGVNDQNFSRGFDTYSRSELNLISPKEQYGDEYRATPEDFPTGNMIHDRVTPLPDIFANATYGDRFLNQKLGIMIGGSFQNSYRPVSNYFYDPATTFREGNPLLMSELIERETSSQMQRIAFHGKLDYDINKNHNINFYYGKYLLNEFRVRDQTRRENFSTVNNYTVYPITRFSNIFQDIATYDLGGKHTFFKNLSASWHAVYSVAKNDLPDDGVFSRTGNIDLDSGNSVINETVYFQGARNSRAWERNQDTDISLYVDFSYRPNLINENTEFQFGGVFRNKVRDNYYNYYNYAQVIGQTKGIDWNDFSEVGFVAMANPLGSGDRSNLVYDAAENIRAGYFNTKWNLAGTEIQAGVRAEQTYQSYEINTLSASSNDIEAFKEQEYLDIFPSFSLKQPIQQNSYLKASYFKGISRPGFYEIVPTIRAAGGGDSFYSERGNSDLRPSIGHSADIRFEYFPSVVDQILVGIFAKRIIDPIEYGFPQVEGTEESPVTNRILPQNFDDAINFGIEADYTKYFNQLGLRFNYTYTNSSITTNKIVINEDRTRSIVNQTRSLQGQSDHIGNISFLYKNQQSMLDMQLVVNYTGERIAFVSPFFEADHYMRPMTQLDFSIEKGFKNKLVLFIKANNLLNTPYELIVKRPLAFPEDPYPYQVDPTNYASVRRDLFGRSFRLGIRYNLNQ